MPTCPDGHESADADFCDNCGMRIGGAPVAVAASPPGAACPQCGADKSGQFCEACGFNFVTETAAAPALPDPSVPGPGLEPGLEPATNVQGAGMQGGGVQGGGWRAVVSADRAYFDSVLAAGGPDASSIEFPVYCPDRQFTLAGKEMRIGRRSASRGLDPEIDLTGPPTDPGISHLHAVLIVQPDGTWSVLDPGSSNGTQVNGNDLVNGVPFPLHDGDRVCLGAWTVLTIQAP